MKTIRGVISDPKLTRKILAGREVKLALPVEKDSFLFLPGKAFRVHLRTGHGKQDVVLETTEEPIDQETVQESAKKLSARAREFREVLIFHARKVKNLREIFCPPRRHPLHFSRPRHPLHFA